MTPDTQHAALVLRVNELFHDLEGAEYANVHPEIFEAEGRRWDRLLDRFVARAMHPMHCIDVGCGTGFVSERVMRIMHSGDSLICADISETMLNVCRKKFDGNERGIAIDMLKLHDESISLPDAVADLVVLNSVLHHVPNAQRFLSELTRVLKPGGLLMIGHEPNCRFWQSNLRRQYLMAHAMVPKRLAATMLKFMGLYNGTVKQKHDVFLDELNALLLAEGTISTPLTRTDVSRLVDVHSPTAGGIRANEGFDPFTLLDGLPMQTMEIETYNHLSKMSDAPLLRPYVWLLGKLLPRDGATFFLVARKRA